MSKKTDVWMPLYIGDYLADTGRLTTEQHGAYFLIIMDYWRNGAPPDDDDALAAITRLHLPVWKKHRKSIERMFTIVDGDWVHKRIEEELQLSKNNKEKSVKRGKAGAEKRWNKQCLDDASSIDQAMLDDASSIDQAMLDPMLKNSPSPSPSPNTEINTANAVSSVLPKHPPCQHSEIIALYHSRLPGLKRVTESRWQGSARATNLARRWAEDPRHQTLEFWEWFFNVVAADDFYSGRSGKWTGCDLGWLVERKNFDKVIDLGVSGNQARAA